MACYGQRPIGVFTTGTGVANGLGVVAGLVSGRGVPGLGLTTTLAVGFFLAPGLRFLPPGWPPAKAAAAMDRQRSVASSFMVLGLLLYVLLYTRRLFPARSQGGCATVHRPV